MPRAGDSLAELRPLLVVIALPTVALAFAIYVGYFLHYPPYHAFPRSHCGRVQSAQAVARGAGIGVALLAGGLLLAAWGPLSLVLAAVAVLAATVALVPIGAPGLPGVAGAGVIRAGEDRETAP